MARRKPRPLTAAEWATCDDPVRLFDAVGKGVSDRRLVLYAVACLDHTGLPGRSAEQAAEVEVAERFADGRATIPELRALWLSPDERASPRKKSWPEKSWTWARYFAGVRGHWNERRGPLLRCLFGNPFQPVAFDPDWRTETAVALAAGIYAKKAFDRLPILADALDDAGCNDPDVLGHCRHPGPHARGCWVVDGVLGKL